MSIFLNDWQQTFAISIGSNLAGSASVVADSRESAQVLLINQLESQAGAQSMNLISILNTVSQGIWTVDFRPHVYVALEDIKEASNPNGEGNTYTAVATNAVYVAKRTGVSTPDLYVVAVAGTQPGSLFATFVEDADILPVDFIYGSPEESKPKISGGTANGVYNVLYNMNKGTYYSPDQDLVSYLSTIQEDGIQLVFTGHSLGGAIVPALATAIFNENTKVNTSLKNQASDKNWMLNIYPTAGPDVGNQDYVDLVRTSFPAPSASGGIYQWNAKVWNSLDMVPHVWSNEFTPEIFTLYGSDCGDSTNDCLDTPDYVTCILKSALELLNAEGENTNPYQPLDSKPAWQFSGTFVQPSTIPGYDCGTCSDNSLPPGLCDFMGEVLYQHMTGYIIAFGLPAELGKFLPLPGFCKSAQGLYDPNSPCAKSN